MRTSPRLAGRQPAPPLAPTRRTGRAREHESGSQAQSRTLSTNEADLGPEDAPEVSTPGGDSRDNEGAARPTSADGVGLPGSATPRYSGPPTTNPPQTATATVMEEELQNLPLGGRPSRKHITIQPFSGRAIPGALDTGVRKWWWHFYDQLVEAQVVDGHRWSNMQLRSILSGSLCDLAADWFIHFKRDNPAATLDAAGQRLIAQFSSPLSESALRRALMEMRKRRAETYSEYASRLIDAADSLPGGAEDEANCRQAVYAFVEHTHPKFELDLDRIARKQLAKSWKARAVLYHIVAELMVLTKSNGQAEGSRPKPATKTGPSMPLDVHDQRAHDQREVKRAKGVDGLPVATKHEAHAVIVDRAHASKSNKSAKGKRTWKVNSKTRCYNCNKYGHISANCPKKSLAGAAAAALKEGDE